MHIHGYNIIWSVAKNRLFWPEIHAYTLGVKNNYPLPYRCLYALVGGLSLGYLTEDRLQKKSYLAYI